MCLCVCVCVREREKEKEREYTCDVCMYVCKTCKQYKIWILIDRLQTKNHQKLNLPRYLEVSSKSFCVFLGAASYVTLAGDNVSTF